MERSINANKYQYIVDGSKNFKITDIKVWCDSENYDNNVISSASFAMTYTEGLSVIRNRCEIEVFIPKNLTKDFDYLLNEFESETFIDEEGNDVTEILKTRGYKDYVITCVHNCDSEQSFEIHIWQYVADFSVTANEMDIELQPNVGNSEEVKYVDVTTNGGSEKFRIRKIQEFNENDEELKYTDHINVVCDNGEKRLIITNYGCPFLESNKNNYYKITLCHQDYKTDICEITIHYSFTEDMSFNEYLGYYHEEEPIIEEDIIEDENKIYDVDSIIPSGGSSDYDDDDQTNSLTVNDITGGVLVIPTTKSVTLTFKITPPNSALILSSSGEWCEIKEIGNRSEVEVKTESGDMVPGAEGKIEIRIKDFPLIERKCEIQIIHAENTSKRKVITVVNVGNRLMADFIGVPGDININIMNKDAISMFKSVEVDNEELSPIKHEVQKNIDFKVNYELVSKDTIGGDMFSGCIQLKNMSLFEGIRIIENKAFNGCKNLTEIVIPNTVTTISVNAFNECTSLESIAIPSSVTSIENGAFNGCTNLKKVTIDSNSIISKDYDTFGLKNMFGGQVQEYVIGENVYSIGKNAFNGCTSLTNVEIPYTVYDIKENAFKDCTKINEITIPTSITSIGNGAFNGCTSLKNVILNSNAIVSANYSTSSNIEKLFGEQVTEYVIGNLVSSIGDYAFYGCNNLTSITIGSSVKTIGKNAFDGCGFSLVMIPSGVTFIDDYAFQNCTNITEIRIPKNVESIGEGVFNACNNLTEMAIDSNTIVNMELNEILNSSVTNFIIGNNVTSIVNNSISSIPNIKTLSVEEENKIYDSRDDSNAVIKTDANTLVIGSKNTKIPEDIKIIGNNAFYGCDGLTEITIPDSVTNIGDNAFYDCDGLAKINIGKGLSSIGENVFGGCSSLKTITIPEENTKYKSDGNAIIEKETNTLIIGCKGSEITDGVVIIGNNAFYECEGLLSITIPDSVTSIGDYAFYGCNNLTGITIGKSMSSIGNNVFGNCPSITTIEVDEENEKYKSENNSIIEKATNTLVVGCKETEIPNDIVNIGNNAFYGCTGLESVTIPKSVTTIAVNAFYGCSNLVDVTIDSDTILSETFAYGGGINSTFGDNVSKYTIGNNATFIGKNAFANCSGATDIIIGNGVTYIDNNAFSGCISITEMTIPESVTFIGDSAFYNCVQFNSEKTEVIGGLEIVNIGSGVISVGNNVFYGCGNLKEVNFGKKVNAIGSNIFNGCNLLETITVDEDNEKYDSRDNCNAIIETETNTLIIGCKGTAIIPDDVVSINDNVFNGCVGLTEITIGSGVTSIGSNCFMNCTNLDKVHVKPTTPPTLGNISVFVNNAMGRKIYVPEGSLEVYTSNEMWAYYSEDIVKE